MQILQYLINGVSIGAVYAIIALGYTMVYGIAKMLNFAHGDVIMVGAYISFCVTNYLGLPAVVSILVAMVVCTVLGILIEGLAYKPLRGTPSLAVLITAIGVSYLLQNTATYVTGGQPMTYPAIALLTRTVDIAGTPTKLVVIITPFLVLALIVLLTQLINHTKIGMAMRAVSKDFETSRLMGIKINKVISTTFIIGSALAVVGSILYFTTYPAITPTAGAMPGLKSFVAAVFGGIGSIPGAVIGAFLIGICETIIKGLPSEWNVSVFSDAFTFALLIIILTCKPTGLFGEKATDKV